MFAVQAHVFQIDQQTKKRWVPVSTSAIRVAYYHDPIRGTFRIIAIENTKVGPRIVAWVTPPGQGVMISQCGVASSQGGVKRRCNCGGGRTVPVEASGVGCRSSTGDKPVGG